MNRPATARASVLARLCAGLCLAWLGTLGAAQAQPAAAASAASAIGYKPDGDFGPLLLQATLVLAGLAAAFVAGAYGLKRLRGHVLGPVTRRLRVAESLRLAPRTTLWLVEVDGRTVLLGQHGQQLSLLVGTGALPALRVEPPPGTPGDTA